MINFCSHNFKPILQLISGNGAVHLGLPVVKCKVLNEAFLHQYGGIYLVLQDDHVVAYGKYSSTFQLAWMYNESKNVFRPSLVKKINSALDAGSEVKVYAQDELTLRKQVEKIGKEWISLDSLKNHMKSCITDKWII
ncbi:hypothetical protein AM218_04025 [Hymenobacter sp. DG25A]|nr:hypothetical protein AM218_04025 [Hymenobacter sp. DG25A]